MAEEAKKCHLDIVGVSSTRKRGFGIVDFWMLSGSFYIQVQIQPCMLKRVREFSRVIVFQTVCLNEFAWSHGFVC